MADAVDHPKHYNIGKIEVIDAIDDWHLGFYEGNVVKYVVRAEHKNKQVEDLEKAAWYLARRITQLRRIADALEKERSDCIQGDSPTDG